MNNYGTVTGEGRIGARRSGINVGVEGRKSVYAELLASLFRSIAELCGVIHEKIELSNYFVSDFLLRLLAIGRGIKRYDYLKNSNPHAKSKRLTVVAGSVAFLEKISGLSYVRIFKIPVDLLYWHVYFSLLFYDFNFTSIHQLIELGSANTYGFHKLFSCNVLHR